MTLPVHDASAGNSLRKGMGVFVFLVVLAMFPYTEDPTGDIKYLICSWAGLLLAVGWFVGTRRGDPPVRPQLFLEILLLFLLLNVIASLRSSYVGNSLGELGKLGAFFVLYLVASQVYRTPEQVRRLMLVTCAAVAVSSAYALFMQRVGADFFPWSDRTSDVYTNLPGTFGNPNYAAHTLILATIMAVYLAVRPNRVWCLGFAALFLVHLRFTHQRGGVVALAAALALVVVAWRTFSRLRRPVAAAAASLVIVAVLGAAGILAMMGMSKYRSGSPYPLDLSLLVRYKSYCSAARMVLTRPMLGYGTGNYKIEYPQFWTPYEQKWFAQELKLNAHVHNDLLEIAADAGLPAAGLYLAFLVLGMGYGLLLGFTRENPLLRRLGYTFAALFCAFLVDGLFGFNLRVPVSAALLFIMAGALEGVWSASAPRASARFGIGLSKAFRAGMLVLALACAVLESTIFVSQMLLQRGGAEVYRKRYPAAETFLAWGEKLAPWNWDFPRQRGVAALGRQDVAGAVSHFERARQRNPYAVTTLVSLARAMLGRTLAEAAGQRASPEASLASLDQAGAQAQRALEICPMFAGAEDVLGHVASDRAMLLGKAADAPGNPQRVQAAWREAEEHFDRAIHFGAKNAGEVYRQIAQARIALENQAGAEDAIMRATQADPTDEVNWPFFYGFACSAKRYDRFRNALAWRISRLSEKTPPDADGLATAYLWLADIDQQGYNNLDGAESAYRNAVDAQPRRPDAWSAYARFAATANRLDAFKTFLTETNSRLLTKGRQPLPHVTALAKVWKRGSEALVEAGVLLVGVIQGKVPVPGMRPADLDMKWAVTLLLDETDRASLSIKDAGATLMHLGMVCAAINELDLADQVFSRAMAKLAPELQGVCGQHWADVLVHLRRSTEAVNLLRDLGARLPDNTDVKISLARTLAKSGNVAEARNVYEQVLQSPALDESDRTRIQGELEAVSKP